MNIRSSYDSFRDLRENDSYYVDKSRMIEEYLVDRFDKAVLFARPRRFGKTLTMTMFRDFLDIRQDSKDIFKGLEIMNRPEVVEAFMNKYPVVFLSLKEVFAENYSKTFESLQLTISEVCKTYDELMGDDAIGQEDKKLLALLRDQSANEANTVGALGLLSRLLRMHYKKQVFVLIDEYDVPMAKAYNTPDYEKVRDMIEHMLSYVCKTNDNVKAVMLSGCLYTVKNSTYTGVNNIIPYTVLSPNYSSYIGFTDDDVRKILDDAGISDRYDTVAAWYDGYYFGRDKMYCPWDVLLYVRSILDNTYSEAMGPKSYWVNTSETSQNIIHGFLGRTSGVDKNFECLLAGDSIDCVVNDNLPYHKIHESGDNLWSALLETGYLTKAVAEEMPLMPLRIPNKEIQMVFRQEVADYFKNRIDNVFVHDLVDALWAGEIKNAKASLDQILEATLSFYHEFREYSYHLILDGFFTGMGYRVQSERESGYGRSDLIIQDPARNRCLILELKHVSDESEMQQALEEACEQIDDKKYASVLTYEGFKSIHKYGIACHGKKCEIASL